MGCISGISARGLEDIALRFFNFSSGSHFLHWANGLTLNAPIATKVVCFSCLLKCLRSLYSVDQDQLFASMLNSSVMLGNYLQQTISADGIFRCIFFLALSGLNCENCVEGIIRSISVEPY